MGTAVMRLHAPHPDQVRSVEWHERGVTLAEILAEMTRLHARLAHQDVTDDAQPHPRNACLNLVAVAGSDEELRNAERTGHVLAGHHPLRTLLIELEPSRTVDRIDAWLRAEAHPAADGMPIQFERVRLKVSGGAIQAVDSLVGPLLAPEVPTCLWWMGTPPFADAGFRRLLAIGDQLAVDSASFERPFEATLELADLAGSVGRELPLADFHWARLQAWREMVAQFFQPPERRDFLFGINAIGVDYAGEGRGNRVAAALLVGWMAAGLAWELKRAAAGTGGAASAFYASPRPHPIEVHLRSVPAGGLAEGEIAAVRIDALAGGHASALSVQRSAERRAQVEVRIDIGEAATLIERLPLETPAPAELLAEMLTSPRDPVYLRALDAGAALLRGFR